MQGRLSRRETGLLYILVLACSLFFFLVGVYFGSGVVPANADRGEGAELVQQPPEEQEDKPELDFYDDLRPGSSGTERAGSSPRVGEPVRQQAPEQESLQDVVVEEPLTIQAPREKETAAAAEMPPPPQAATRSEPSSGALFYTVQVGAFRTREEVEQVVLRLTARGYSSNVIEPGPDAFYRIWVGQSQDQERIQVLEAQLKDDGFDTYVRSYREPAN